MIYDFKKESDIKKARYVLEKHISSKSKCEVKKIIRKRTLSQNSALHLFFTNIADQLNELGEVFNYTGFNGKEMDMMFTPELIKNTLWKQIQKALFGIDSTKDLDTKMINDILDVIINFFAKKGIPITFPSQFELYLKLLNEENNKN